MEEYYYYCRDKDNVPLVTVCLMRQDEIVVRGVSICSPLDSPCKKEGKRIARNKALKALGLKKTGDEIKRDRAVKMIYNVTDKGKNNSTICPFKSVYNPALNIFEQKILSIGLEKVA